MNYCFTVQKEKRKELAAIVHKDNTCRIQTVSFQRPTTNDHRPDNLYFSLISEFYRLSGVPCILNTSFNLKGEPIAESPEQAVNDFMKTKMDVLYIGSFEVKKQIYFP